MVRGFTYIRLFCSLKHFTMHPFMTIGVRAVRKAGNMIARYYQRLDELTIEQKGVNDFVTQVDREAERMIIETITESYPEHGFLGEEGVAKAAKPNADATWIIDPIDGTTNFTRGYPDFVVSLACREGDDITHGIIYHPLTQELFTASNGSGAQLDGRRIRVSQQRGLKGSMITAPFTDRPTNTSQDQQLAIVQHLLTERANLRRSGSAALNLAYVACGRLDVFWGENLKTWDIAAGELLVREAGGYVTDLVGELSQHETGNILATNPKLHDHFIQLLK